VRILLLIEFNNVHFYGVRNVKPLRRNIYLSPPPPPHRSPPVSLNIFKTLTDFRETPRRHKVIACL